MLFFGHEDSVSKPYSHLRGPVPVHAVSSVLPVRTAMNPGPGMLSHRD